jgi:hypothetical protein
MSNRSGQKKQVLWKRDGPHCGIHVGGCGETITIQEAEIDHVIPKNLYTSLVDYPSQFNKRWNMQLMHPGCNRNKGSEINYNPPNPNEQFVFTWTNAPDQLPTFRCQCHYWQIFEGDVYVCTQGILGQDQHKFLSAIIADYEEPRRQDVKMIVQFRVGRDGRPGVGYDRSRNMGYALPTIPSRLVTAFNFAERHRVGLPTPYYPLGHASGGSIWKLNRQFQAQGR